MFSVKDIIQHVELRQPTSRMKLRIVMISLLLIVVHLNPVCSLAADGHVGTLTIAVAFDEGIVIAADGKGSAQRGTFKQIKNRALRDSLMYYEKLFSIGNNLCAAYGGQVLRNHHSWMLPEELNELFKKGFSLTDNASLDFDRTANDLFMHLKEYYYRQPEFQQFNESSIILAGIDKGNKLAILLVNSPGDQFQPPGDDLIILSDFENIMRRGPHHEKVESRIAESHDKYSLIQRKLKERTALSREEAIDYTLFLMRSCIEEEAKEKTREKRSIDYPISYAVVQENGPIRVMVINK